MANTHIVIPEDYTYEAPNGRVFTGRAAFILNHLDSAEAALHDKQERHAPLWPSERRVYEALDTLLDRASWLAYYL